MKSNLNEIAYESYEMCPVYSLLHCFYRDGIGDK